MGVILSGVRERPGGWKLAYKHTVAVVFIPCKKAKDQFKIEACECLHMWGATRTGTNQNVVDVVAIDICKGTTLPTREELVHHAA